MKRKYPGPGRPLAAVKNVAFTLGIRPEMLAVLKKVAEKNYRSTSSIMIGYIKDGLMKDGLLPTKGK